MCETHFERARVSALQERWLDNRDCAYMQGSSSGELPDGERRLKRFVPFSDGIKNCLGQVRGGACVVLNGSPARGCCSPLPEIFKPSNRL